jgi:glycosyltransferase involved in cell wall biosynthesis/phospholipid N-methyltransferase
MPVFNERFLVAESVRRVLAFSDTRISSLEIVIVDDGSSDGTGDVVRGLAAGDDRVHLIEQPTNQGKGAAVRAAIRMARGDLCVVQDADLEYSPSDWGRMLDPFFEAGADAVYGSRFLASEYRRVLYFRHTIGNRLLTFLSNLATDLNLTDMETCYKMFRTPLIQSIPIRSSDFSFEPEVTAKLAKRGAVIFEVPIRYAGRTYQEGKKIGFRHALTALLAIVRWWVFDDIYKEDEYGSDILTSLTRVQRFNAWMADEIKPFVGESVLEIGAGIGNISLHLMPRTKYAATDINPHYLRFLASLEPGRAYLEVRKLDLEDRQGFEKFADTVDTVICLNVLEHVADESAALANIFDALQPGGRAIILVPHGKWLYSSLDRALGHIKRYSRAELSEALGRAGFEVEPIRTFNRVGVPGWVLNGKILHRKAFSRIQLKVLNTVMPLVRRLDFVFPWSGLSLLAVGRKPESISSGMR